MVGLEEKHKSADALEDDFIASSGSEVSDGEEQVEELETKAEDEANSAALKRKRKRRERREEIDSKDLELRKSAFETSSATVCQFWNDIWNDVRRPFNSLNLTTLELEEIKLTESSIFDPNLLGLPHTSENYASLVANLCPDYESLFPGFVPHSRRKQKGGSVRLLIVCASAIRAVNVIRHIKHGTLHSNGDQEDDPTLQVNGKRRRFNGGKQSSNRHTFDRFEETPFQDLQIGKLFAKHFNPEQQKAFLESTAGTLSVAVGTPNRLWKLAKEMKCLQLNSLNYLVIDSSFQDSKKRTIFDEVAIKKDLYKFVKDCISMRLKTGKAKLCLF